MSAAGQVIAVWITIQLLGSLALPMTVTVFKNIPGRGYFFSKTLAILATSYLTWSISSLSCIPFGTTSIWAGIAILGFVSLYFGVRERTGLMVFIKSNRVHIFTVEVLFLTSLVLFTVIKSFNPDIIPTTERFMDFALVKSILRGADLPLNDPWYTGETMNYYYFGHLMAAVLNHLSGLPTEVFFNIAVALVFSLLTMGSFSLGYILTGKTGYGALSATFVTLIGNMDGLIQVFHSHKIFPFDWFGSSRIIPGTINEFPFFSFLWGDLHAYVLAFSLIIMVLSLGYNLLMSEGSGFALFGRDIPERILHLWILGISLGSLILVNSWDFPAYAFIILSTILIQQVSANQGRFRDNFIKISILAGVVIAVSITTCIPYFGSFQQSRDIGVVVDKTTLNEFLTIFGLFLFIFISFLIFMIIKINRFRMNLPLFLFVVFSLLIISHLTPTFVVKNATSPGGIPLTYTFQVSTQEDFSDLVDSATEVPDGNESAGAGLTAWTVTVELTDGATYYLRVRANDGAFDGPFMTAQEIEVDATPIVRLGDFNNDFVVDLDDFFQFAVEFGKDAIGEKAVLDLSGNGKVDLDDFFTFAGLFGTEYENPGGSKPAVASSIRTDPSVRATFKAVSGFPAMGEEFTASIDFEGTEDLKGYGVRIEYDPDRLHLMGVEQLEGELARVIRLGSDEVVVLNFGEGIVGRVTDPERKGGVRLANLRFRVTGPSREAPAQVSDLVVLDGQDQLRTPEALGFARLSLVPDQVVLLHNYPNPFNPVTTIRYGIPEEARTSIMVYNILGQQIAVLVDEMQPAGYYTVAWDGRDNHGRRMGSGVYLYRIKVGKVAVVKKMLLLK